jgi:hypothetical protein
VGIFVDNARGTRDGRFHKMRFYDRQDALGPRLNRIFRSTHP